MRKLASDVDQLTVVTETFRLLGDLTRLRILLACLTEPKYVADVAAEVGISASLTSHHLRLLRAARLVRFERHGRQMLYVAADDHVNAMVAEMVAHIRQSNDIEDDELVA